jgi:hypothetical protein
MAYYLLFVMWFQGQQLEWTLGDRFETEAKCKQFAEHIAIAIGPMARIRVASMTCLVEYSA